MDCIFESDPQSLETDVDQAAAAGCILRAEQPALYHNLADPLQRVGV